MRKHRKTRRQRKKQRKIIIVTSLSLLFIMSVGYAAFNTNLNITAKGSIKDYNASWQLTKNVVSTGDGLYKDYTEAGRYIYKGANPNNYITFNGEKAGWRIISVENDGTLKIMKSSSIGNKQFDTPGTRYVADSYCGTSDVQSYGCNIWGSKNTVLDSSGNNISKIPRESGSSTIYDLPETEASLNIELNTTYYDSLLESDKLFITPHFFNIGLISYDNANLQMDVSNEQNLKWKGNIGLIAPTDFVKASTDLSCTNIYSSTISPFPCKNNNYLYYKDGVCRAITPFSKYPHSASDFTHIVGSSGVLNSWCIRPTLFLKSNIKLTGSGTENNPYVIRK